MSKVYITGSAGRIEAMYNPAEKEGAPCVIVFHPHPLYGGTMQNKLTHGMAKQFALNGFSVLRINFRGVGNSDGKFANGLGELDDAGVALDWLEAQNPKSTQFWISGFSFGAWIGMQLVMRRPEVDFFVVASPPVSRYNFNFFIPCPTPGLVIQPENDEISLPASTENLVSKVRQNGNSRISLEMVEGASHFFQGCDQMLFDSIDSCVKEALHVRNPMKVIKYRKRQRKTQTA
jgi:uncharacterized protein